MKTRWILTLALLLAMLLPSTSLAEGAVFHVAPSGDDDTAALENALALAQAAGPDSVVELEAGDYYVGHALIVYNWSGTIRGAGKDATILHTIDDTLEGGLMYQSPYGPYGNASMLMFMYDDGAQGHLALEGLGFRPTGLTTFSDPIGDAYICPVTMANATADGRYHVDTVLRDLHTQGDIDAAYPGGNNQVVALLLLNNSADVSVSDVLIERTLAYGIIANMWQGGSLTVGGPRPTDQVRFLSIGAGGIFGFGNTGTAFEITNVFAENVGVVYQQQALSGGRVHMSGVETISAAGAAVIGYWGPLDICPTAPSTYVFEHNTLRAPEGAGWPGFMALENCEVKSQFVISQNRIESAVIDFRGSILLTGTRGAVVTSNLLSGTAMAAISLGLWGGDDSGAVLKGNNLQGFEGMAGVLLAAATSGNTVVGGGNLSGLVFDETDDPLTPEYDGANILSGVNSAGGAIGDAVREAMMLRKDVRELCK